MRAGTPSRIRLFFLLFASIAFVTWGISRPADTPLPVRTYLYAIAGSDSLHLDLRIPAQPNTAVPAVLFLHGGGFSSGARDVGPHVALLDALASAGIASASVTYQLSMKGPGFGCNVTAESKQRAVDLAAHDALTALDWLEQQHTSIGLDSTQQWIIMGSSAGAEAAMWAAYGVSPDRFAGVVSFSGALADGMTMPASPPPFFGCHGLNDAVVPPEKALHRGCSPEEPGAWLLCGGRCWSQRMIESGHPAHFYGDCLGDHGFCNAAMLDSTIRSVLVQWIMDGERRNTEQWRYRQDGGASWSSQRCQATGQ